MNGDLADFVLARPFGFLRDTDLPQLIRLDRLCLVLVRLGKTGGRFLAPAQDVGVLIEYAEKAGDYVRDVSVASETIEQAKAFRGQTVDDLA